MNFGLINCIISVGAQGEKRMRVRPNFSSLTINRRESKFKIYFVIKKAVDKFMRSISSDIYMKIGIKKNCATTYFIIIKIAERCEAETDS